MPFLILCEVQMKHSFIRLAACLAVFPTDVAWSQASPHVSQSQGTSHHSPHRSRPAVAPDSSGAFVSPLADYRRFDADVPLVDWRAANEEVKNAGGHVGLARDREKDARAPADPKAASPPAKGHR